MFHSVNGSRSAVSYLPKQVGIQESGPNEALALMPGGKA